MTSQQVNSIAEIIEVGNGKLYRLFSLVQTQETTASSSLLSSSSLPRVIENSLSLVHTFPEVHTYIGNNYQLNKINVPFEDYLKGPEVTKNIIFVLYQRLDSDR